LAAFFAENAALHIRLAAIEKIVDENYSDLLDQMDEAWGRAREIGRVEINAFLESRIVHKPTASVRKQLATAERRAEEAERTRDECTAEYDKGVRIFEQETTRLARIEKAAAAVVEDSEPLAENSDYMLIEKYRIDALRVALEKP
jgi:hypothetical protein